MAALCFHSLERKAGRENQLFRYVKERRCVEPEKDEKCFKRVLIELLEVVKK